MNNGANNWGVTYGRISWLENAIKLHANVVGLRRRDDIVMEVVREAGCPLTVICLDEYSLGVSGVHRVMGEFPDVNFISVGGNWNGYTPEAKKLCLSNEIGLFNSSELAGALWKDDFWNYHKRDDEGNPVYSYN